MAAPALLDMLQSHGITKATVIGAKVGYAVQATAQALCSEGLLVSVVRDCVAIVQNAPALPGALRPSQVCEVRPTTDKL